MVQLSEIYKSFFSPEVCLLLSIIFKDNCLQLDQILASLFHYPVTMPILHGFNEFLNLYNEYVGYLCVL